MLLIKVLLFHNDLTFNSTKFSFLLLNLSTLELLFLIITAENYIFLKYMCKMHCSMELEPVFVQIDTSERI